MNQLLQQLANTLKIPTDALQTVLNNYPKLRQEYIIYSSLGTVRNTMLLIIAGMADIVGNAIIASINDYDVFRNNWSSNRYFTYTKSNRMWKVGCFYGTGEELIKKAYADSEESGQNYERYVKFAEERD